MPRLLSWCLLAALAGCALTPAEVSEQGTRRTAAARLPPAQAAVCIERNAENRSAYYVARQRALDDGVVEVVIRFTEILGVLAIVRLHPEGTGSAIEMWTSPNVLVDAGDLTKHFISGC